MDDTTGLPRTVLVGTAGYPLFLARTLMQLGYEPASPDEHGRLPNIFSYISMVREQKGYLSLYTGFRFYLPAIVLKKVTYNLMASAINHKMEKSDCDMITFGVGYISSTFFGSKDTVEFTFEALYRGVIPKLIIEVTMIWVSALSRRLFTGAIEDELGLQIACRVPPFIVQSLLYPLNVASTVMADGGRSGVNPRFSDWKECYRYLQINNQHKRGSSFFYRRHFPKQTDDRYSIIKRYI